jgi:alpha-beta hydrolase superfamily lysophospholipase
MKEEFVDGQGGVKLHVRSWRGSGTPKAAVAIVHGLKAHSGLYEWPGEQLSQRGFAVYALDLRGHGRSEGERLWVDQMADWVADVQRLVALVRSREPGIPVFLLGHSAGGVISCIYVLDHQAEVDGLLCESFAHEIPTPDFALTVLKGVGRVAPHAHVLKLKDDLFSRDTHFVNRMKSDPLIPREGYPSRTIAELVRADERLKREFSKITLPVLILHGTKDGVTKPHGSQLFHERAGSPDKTLKLYEDHYHDLLNDFGREQVLADIIDWLDARLPRSSAAGQHFR